MSNQSATLSVSGLRKSYGSFEAVKGISFEVAKGEVFALVGPNGAGKSTTLKMVSTILSPTGGTATVCGLDIQEQAGLVREKISYLPEEAGAYKNLTGQEYLEFMASLWCDDPVLRAEAVKYGASVSALGEKLEDKIKTYSKGMTRKLLLARAIMLRPPLAVLDEPTSGLDIINAFEIRNTIKTLAAEGMSVLVSSHNMLEVEFLSNRVAIVNHGMMLACDTPERLKTAHNARNLEEVFMELNK